MKEYTVRIEEKSIKEFKNWPIIEVLNEISIKVGFLPLINYQLSRVEKAKEYI